MAGKADYVAAMKAIKAGKPAPKHENPFLATAFWWLNGGAEPGSKPREGEIQRLLSNEKSIAKCYGYEVNKDKHIWRIYMEYVGNRNLEQLVRDEITRGTTTTGVTPIPGKWSMYSP